MPTIMVIDDDRQFCKLMEKMLELDGYRVTTHHSIATARVHLEQELPDLLCCDMKISGDNGFDFLVHRQEIHGLLDVPFIAITGDNRLSSQIKATELGIFAYLIKPFNRRDLISTIESALVAKNQKINSSVTGH